MWTRRSWPTGCCCGIEAAQRASSSPRGRPAVGPRMPSRLLSRLRCNPSRELLRHHQKCTSPNCPVCAPVKQYVSKQRQLVFHRKTGAGPATQLLPLLRRPGCWAAACASAPVCLRGLSAACAAPASAAWPQLAHANRRERCCAYAPSPAHHEPTLCVRERCMALTASAPALPTAPAATLTPELRHNLLLHLQQNPLARENFQAKHGGRGTRCFCAS